MNQYKIYRKDNYICITDNVTLKTEYGHVKQVFVDKSNTNKPAYRFFEIKDWDDTVSLVIDQILKEDGSVYTTSEFDTFYTQNTGNFNGGGSAPGVQSVTGSSVDNTDPANPIINAVEEAPGDGETYGRQDGNWVVVSGGGGSQGLQQTLDISGEVNNEDSEILFKDINDVDEEFDVVSIDRFGVSVNKENGFETSLQGDNIVFKREGNITNLIKVNDLSEVGVVEISLPKTGGLITNPLVLATEDQINLQQTLNNGGEASFNEFNQYIRIFDTLAGNNVFELGTTVIDGVSDNSSTLYIDETLVDISNGKDLTGDRAQLTINEGNFQLAQSTSSGGTTVKFITPTVISNISFPAPIVNGNYTLALKEDLTPTINIIADGNFTIPTGTDTKMLTFTDADPQIVVLPVIADAIGSIYFISNDSSGTLDMNSNTGGNDIWDSGTLVPTKPILSGTILRVINDGLNFKIL